MDALITGSALSSSYESKKVKGENKINYPFFKPYFTVIIAQMDAFEEAINTWPSFHPTANLKHKCQFSFLTRVFDMFPFVL